MAGGKDGDLEVQVARIDERVLALTHDFHDLKTSQKEHTEETKVLLQEIVLKVGKQNGVLQGYRNDRKWVVSIFGALYGILIAWIEWRSH